MRKTTTGAMLALTLLLGMSSGAWAADFKAGDKVMVEDAPEWYPGTVTKFENGKYYIHFSRYGSPEDIVVMPNHVRVADVEVKPPAPSKIVTRNPGDQRAYETVDQQIALALATIAANATDEQVFREVEQAGIEMRKYDSQLKFLPVYPELIKQFWTLAPAEFAHHINRGIRFAKEATADTEMNVSGSIADGPRQAEKVLEAYKAYDGKSAAEVTRLETELAAARATIAAEYVRINRSKLATKKMPADSYNGADKAKLKAMVIAAWKKNNPSWPILAVRAPKGWERNTGWTSHYTGSQWHDVSSLYFWVIAKKDADVAKIYDCSVSFNGSDRNHLEVQVPGPGADCPGCEEMLVKNVK